ncbi:phage head-tail connector protein [Nitrospirillum amazonense]|uniref:head-tail connector protein n=1 Tax=Nitrospirillum amazonense TaxID=28077 RepID=UPI002DD43303|nr:phage head-tail connector protein [Nitrospirillum amazonense]MEC4590561.1 phage head-tail connector protein [Nitrospirillum amazonense]
MLDTVTPPATDLLSLDQAKEWLSITDSSTDDLLAAAITRASAAVTSYIGRPLLVGAYRETIEVPALAKEVALARWPVTALTAVTIGGDALDVDADVRMDGDTGTLCRLDTTGRSRPWYWGCRAVLVVTYDAGFTEAPADAQDATLQLITAAWSARGRDPGLRSIGIGDISLSYVAATAQPSVDTVAHLLDAYRVPGIG